MPHRRTTEVMAALATALADLVALTPHGLRVDSSQDDITCWLGHTIARLLSEDEPVHEQARQMLDLTQIPQRQLENRLDMFKIALCAIPLDRYSPLLGLVVERAIHDRIITCSPQPATETGDAAHRYVAISQ